MEEHVGRTLCRIILHKVHALLTKTSLEQDIYERIIQTEWAELQISRCKGLSVAIALENKTKYAEDLQAYFSEKFPFHSVKLLQGAAEFEEYIFHYMPDILAFTTGLETENSLLYKQIRKMNPRVFQVIYTAKNEYLDYLCSGQNMLRLGDEKLTAFVFILKGNKNNRIINRTAITNRTIEGPLPKSYCFVRTRETIKRLF